MFATSVWYLAMISVVHIFMYFYIFGVGFFPCLFHVCVFMYIIVFFIIIIISFFLFLLFLIFVLFPFTDIVVSVFCVVFAVSVIPIHFLISSCVPCLLRYFCVPCLLRYFLHFPFLLYK